MGKRKRTASSGSKGWDIKILPGTNTESVRLAVRRSGDKVITVKGKRKKLSDYVDESLLTRAE